MPLNANQEAALQELANTYKAYLLQGADWPMTRTHYPCTGGFIIDNLIENDQFMKGVLDTIHLALKTSPDSKLFKNAQEICKMFSALYERDPSFRPCFYNAMKKTFLFIDEEILKDPSKLVQKFTSSSKPYDPLHYHRGRLLC